MQNRHAVPVRYGYAPPVVRSPVSLVSGAGVMVGLSFLAASLTPSLVPRDALFQGLIGGVLFAFGYGLAVAAIALWRWLDLPEPRRPAARVMAAMCALAGVAIALPALALATDWQNSIRVLMGLAPLDETHPWRAALVAVCTAAGVFFVGWLFRLVVRLIARRTKRYVPERTAALLGLLTGLLLFGTLINGVLVRTTLQVLDASYAELDALIEPDSTRPTATWKPGSTASLLDWRELGRAGRRFVEAATSQRAVAGFWRDAAREPLRVYVGLGAASTADERAALALAELKRVNAFDRAILLVALPTGTGFLDNAAVATLEYLHRGDVATVAMQYSYLQSPFSLIFEPGYGAEAGRALLRTVYAHWTTLPESGRPRLYLHGLSLGALSSERSVRLHEVLGDPIHGAVWSGPPFPSPIHRSATAERVPGSPEWLPRFDDGSFIRFIAPADPREPDAHPLASARPLAEGPSRERSWGPMRIVYVQHASDPIVFFDTSLFWRKPDWLKSPRGPDVSEAVRWYPIVTGLQIAADMALANKVPLGHGHQYAPDTYVDAWVAVTDPQVSAEDVARLKRHLSVQDG